MGYGGEKTERMSSLNGISDDDKTCGLNDMNCLGEDDDSSCGLNDMNCVDGKDDMSCSLNNMNCEEEQNK